MAPAYYIWRQSPDEQWRVRASKTLYQPKYPGEMAWEGDDYQAGLEECRRLNAERRRKKGEVKG